MDSSTIDNNEINKSERKSILNLGSSSSLSCHVVSFDQEADISAQPKLPSPSPSPSPPQPLTRHSRKLRRLCATSLYVVKICYYIILYGLIIPLVAALLISICSLSIIILLVISVLVTRVFQFFRCGKEYEKLAQFKHLLRIWLTVIPPMALIGLWVFYGFVKHVPYVKQVTVLDLSLAKWALLVTVMCGLCMFTSFLYMVIHGIAAGLMGRHSLNARQACSEIIDGLILWLAAHEVMKRVPSVKRDHQILGLPTEKWVMVSILVLIGYNLITLSTRVFVLLLERICQRPQLAASHITFWQYVSKNYLRVRYIVYYANGMILSLSFVMSSMLLLLTWIFYFGTRLDMKSSTATSIWEYGKWTVVSLFIFSFLWLIKTCVLLAWEARTLHDRLQAQILSTSDQLYFLGFFGSYQSEFSKLKEEVRQEFQARLNNTPAHRFINKSYIENPNYKYNWGLIIVIWIFDALRGGFKGVQQARRMSQNDLLFRENADPNLNQIEQATKHFLDQQDLLEETYVSDILDKFNPIGDNREKLKRLILGEEYNHRTQDSDTEGQEETSESAISSDWDRFVKKLPYINQQDPHEQISFSVIQTWVERAHNQCVNLINTLRSSKEVAGCLNKVISWLLIGVIFIMWLLLTGLATTKVLLLIASPLLAATFIFGNTCKTLFEGILFVYVIHPIDVGDLCYIDEKMMEVKSIGVWTTTFAKVDKFGAAQDLVIYSNTDLATKTITNCRTKFDWSDQAEFNLSPLKKTKVQNQDNVIDFFIRHLNEERLSLTRSPNLSTLATEDAIKLVIRLEYKAEITKEWTYSECLRLKDKLKGEFYLIMQDIITKFEAEYGKKEESQSENKESLVED